MAESIMILFFATRISDADALPLKFHICFKMYILSLFII